MGKIVTFKEKDLLKIRENMVGSSNTASHNTICVNEASPEVDEFELGQESDNPPVGGNYYHVTENSNGFANREMDKVDYIDYIPHDNPREEGYTEENITEFEPYYELMCYDINDNIIFDGELTLNELFDYFPDKIVHALSNREGRKVSEAEWRIEDILSWNTKPNNIDDVEEVNAIAKRIQPGGPSSYILTDGDIVSFPDHIQITSIEGMTPSKFVGLGNIRIGRTTIELSKEPNREQLTVLRDCFRGEEEIYLDIVKDGGRMYPECICSAVYRHAPIDRVINDIIYYFKDGVRPQGAMTYESKKRVKKVIIGEDKLSSLKENIDFEVNSSDIDLSSFKKKSQLAPIWNEQDELNPKIRLKLLDIADDFWNFVNLTWVKPSGIILTGSICNFNWSNFSDIDLHLVVDFDEIDEKTEFVRDYLDAKKNEWNNEHEGLKILDYPVELYVQNLDEMPQSGGIYDLEENAWIKKPNADDIKSIGLNKFSIKDKAANIMTIIDDMYDALNSTTDSHEIEEIGDDAKYLWQKIKKMRRKSLELNGENGSGNIAYKILRREAYLNKLWKLSTLVYDRINSINESKTEKKKYTVYINGKKDKDFSEMNWKRKPKVGKGFYYGGAVFKIKKVTDDSIYAIEENINHNISNSINENVDSNSDMFTMAIEKFGITNDIRECGYILPNGMMLDFSGRHTLKKGTDSSHLRGRRSTDHREISKIGWDGFTKNFDFSMQDFIRLGAIRTHVSKAYSYINFFKKPTPQQFDVITRIIRFSNGCIEVEIGDGYDSLTYGEYDEVKPNVVIAQINRFFDDGINLTESKNILKEYLEKNYNLPLYKYFKWASTASDKEKVMDIIYQCSYESVKYLKRMAKQIQDFEPLRIELIQNEDVIYNDDFVEKFANIIVTHKLTDGFIYNIQVSSFDPNELPSWVVMDFKRIVKNEWCIHFGYDSYNIAREGFTGGTEEIGNLGYTGAGQEKHHAGYNFAFPLGEKDIDFNQYGEEAVIFQTSGVEIFHHGDNQRQVVFWGPYAKNFIPIKYDSNYGEWCIYGANDQILKSGHPSEILDWALDNLPQYRKQIMMGKNGFIPKHYDYNQKKYVPYPLYKNESIKKYITILKENSLIGEEVVADGSAHHNPYAKRWKAERKALKDFICNFGKIMTSKENGKQYKCYYDKILSQLIGYNYCICLQWDPVAMKPSSTLYIRALDKFTNKTFQAQYDNEQQIDRTNNANTQQTQFQYQ